MGTFLAISKGLKPLSSWCLSNSILRIAKERHAVIDPGELKNIAAGASGSAVAAWLARATGWALLGMFGGGVSAAYFVGPVVAEWTSLQHQQSAVGFVVGFLAIMSLRKVVAVVEGFPAETVGGILVARLKKLLRVE